MLFRSSMGDEYLSIEAKEAFDKLPNDIDMTSWTQEQKDAYETLKSSLTSAKTDIYSVASVPSTVNTCAEGAKKAAQKVEEGLSSGDVTGLKDGAKAVSDGAAAVNSGIQDMYKTSSDLSKANTGFKGGITELVGGIADLYDGIKTLSENNEALTTGADTLEKSGSLLTSGIGQLTSSTKTLTSSAKQLSDGAATLSKGTSALDTATGKVNDGIGKLSEGSDKLSDGMSEFKTEGTDKIRNEYNDKVKTVLDRLDSLTGEAGQYNTFSGLADGMDGKVKFIFQTSEIKTED